MGYSNFSALDLKNKFGVGQTFVDDLFTTVAPREVSSLLQATLRQNLTFALNQATEKARSEFIIAPVFAELYVQGQGQLSIFSGVEFNVAPKLGFTGWCDFLVSRSSFQRELEAPVVVAVEAKQDDFRKGISQCIAEMIAAQMFNEKHGHSIEKIYGCVTTGDVWRFLVLTGKVAQIETVSFDIREDLERIVGILYTMALGTSV